MASLPWQQDPAETEPYLLHSQDKPWWLTEPGRGDRICTQATGTNGFPSDITVFSMPVPGPQPMAGDRGEETPAFVEPNAMGRRDGRLAIP